MKPGNVIGGKWSGRLVDAQGFEGGLTLELERGSEGAGVRGSFATEIIVNHAVSRSRGQVNGSLKRDHLHLVCETGDDGQFVIHLNGQLVPLKPRGMGIKATYRVDSRVYSPLQGGIACLSKAQPPTSVAVEVEPMPSVPKPNKGVSNRAGRRRS